MAVTIEIIQGPDKGRVFQISTEAIIGRQSDSLPLSDGTVSRRHARVGMRNKSWAIEDVGSANGTFLNGSPVKKPMELHLGDQIRCGQTLLVFGGSSSRAATPMNVNDAKRNMDAAIMATVPASDDSIIIPTPEAGAEAIGNLRILYDLTTELTSILDLDTLLQRTVNVVFKVVPADHAFILLVGEDGRLIPKAARYRNGIKPSDSDEDSHKELPTPETPIPISRTIINEVLTKQVGVLSSNAMRDKRFGPGKSVHEYGIRSAICAPIKGRDRIIGIIHVDCSVSDHVYSTEQLRLLTAIGYQAGLAAENVRLYEAAVKTERLAAIGETVAFLSHHIKNILQGLVSGADLVEKAIIEGNTNKAGDVWPVVRRSLDRINIVILNMLAFSRPKQPLRASVDVNHIINECIDLLTPHADELGVALITEMNNLPEIPADSTGLHQALLNLLTNALDAVSNNTGVITVSSEFDSMNRQVIVRVVDNGVGIAPDQKDHIFDIFHSAKGQKGTGLGLTVTKKVIDEHGGKIRVESTPGEGTVFTVTLSTQPDETTSPDDTHTP
ncbi:MAG: ATP-binding protein [Planctomycetota bacterium]|nr:ATP-binding protein [Planctomycetota bacterium]